MRILVVDDSRLLRTMLRRTLRQSGISVSHLAEAAAAEEALALLARESFDLVLCDYCMPEMDGREFIEAARERLAVLPRILVVSAQAGPEIGGLLRRAGSNGFLCKPFTVAELRDAIDMAMR